MSVPQELFAREEVVTDGLIVSRFGGRVHARYNYAPLCSARPCESLAEDRLQVLDRQFPMLEHGDAETLAWLKESLSEEGFYGLDWCQQCRSTLSRSEDDART